MKSPDTIVILPGLELALSLARECVTLDCLGAIGGLPGTGKTVALRTIESRYPSFGFGGKCFYLRAYHADGPTRAVKDVVDGLGTRSGIIPSGTTLQATIKIALRDFQKLDVRLLCIDEADAWSEDALRGFVSLYDAAFQERRPFGAIFTGNSDMVKWLTAYAAGLSRTLRCEQFQHLPTDLVLGVLREWGIQYEQLTERLATEDKEARRIASAMAKVTSGNLRRLNYFARLHHLHYREAVPTLESVEGVSALMLQVAK